MQPNPASEVVQTITLLVNFYLSRYITKTTNLFFETLFSSHSFKESASIKFLLCVIYCSTAKKERVRTMAFPLCRALKN